MDGWFEHERPLYTLRQRPHVFCRCAAADFFVGIEEDDRFQWQGQVQRLDRPEGKDDLGQAAFHVKDSGAANDIAVHSERAIRNRTQRPDRIEVTQQQLGG